MAVAVSKLSPNPDFVAGNKRIKFRSLLFSGNYVADGESVTAAQFGLKRFSALIISGGVVPKSSDYALGNPVAVRYSSDRRTAFIVFYDSAGDGDALDEKPAESHVSVGPVTAMAVGV